jgi:hypothetical protein
MWRGIIFVGIIMAAGTLLVLNASMPGGFIHGVGDLRYGQTMAFTTLMLFSDLQRVERTVGRAKRVRSPLHEPMAVGGRRRLSSPAVAGRVCAVSPERLRYRGIDCRGLDVVYRCCQLRVVAEGRHETDRASEDADFDNPALRRNRVPLRTSVHATSIIPGKTGVIRHNSSEGGRCDGST